MLPSSRIYRRNSSMTKIVILFESPLIYHIHRSAQEKLDAVEATIVSLNTEHPDIAAHMRNEVSARQEAAALRSEVECYRRTFGSELNADAERLAARLRESEASREQLILQQKQESAVSRHFTLLREWLMVRKCLIVVK